MHRFPVQSKFVVSLVFCFVIRLCAAAQQNADFSASATSDCESLITSFTDLSAGNPVAWLWDFGNGTTSTKKNPGATYVKTGKYTVSLKVTFGDGSSKTAVKTDYITVRAKPAVNFSVSAGKGCVPFTTAFTDKSTAEGSLQSFSWDFGDGEILQNSNGAASHTYTKSGIYNVILTVTDNYGCTNYKTQEKVVDVAPAINASFDVAEKTLCKAPVDVLFTNTSTGPGTLSYKWEFDDGGTSALKDLKQHTFTSKGTHSIKLTVTNERGCSASQSVNDINVANYATTITGPALICTDQDITFEAAFSPVQPQSTTWELNDQYMWSYPNSVSYRTSTEGPLKVKLTAMYGNCADVVEKTFTVKPTPAGQISTDNKPICSVPATVNFKGDMTGASSWKWNFNNGQTSTLQNPTQVYNQEGGYFVSLTATSKDGCSNYSSTYLYIYQTDVVPYMINSSGCEGLKASFYANINSNDEIKTYLWNFGDGSTSTEAQPQHTYNKAGFYTVTLQYTTANGCTGTRTAAGKVEVYKKPVPDFSSPGAPEVCGNTLTTFIDKSDVGTSWSWDFGDGNYGYGSTATHSYSEPGWYNITLITTNGTCPETTTKTAYINAVNPFPRFNIEPVDCNKRTAVTVSEFSLGATSWKWSWGDGTDTSYTKQSSTVTHTYAGSGTYTIQLTTSDGHCTTYLSKTVTIIASSPITISADKTDLCSSETATFNVTAAASGIYTYYPYYWQVDEGNISWGIDYGTFTYTNPSPGKHAVRLLMLNQLYCYDTSNVINVNAHGPVADFNLPAEAQCKGTELTFTDNTDLTYSNKIVKWQWNFGDNSPSETFTSGPFKHTYQQAGNYYYPTVTVTDQDGCTSNASGKYLQVNGPVAGFYADYTLVKPGSTVNFGNTSYVTGGYITDLKWDFGDGNTSDEPNYVSHFYPDKGLYPVTLQLTDNNGCTDQATQNIKVSAVAAGFTYTSEFVNGSKCAPMIFRFTNTSINYTSCAWDFGDGGTSDQFSPVHTYTESGHYTVKLKVKGDADTEDEYSEVVIVTGPYATITTSDEGGCLEKEITFNIQPENATTFSWDFTDGNVEQTTALEIKHHFTEPGIYKPRLLLKDDAGCKGSAFLDHPVVIDQLDIQLNPSPAKICDAGTLTFAPVFNSYSVDELGMEAAYTWTYDPSLTPEGINTTTPVFHLDQTGEYKFGMTATTKYGCVQTVEVPVNVYPKPLAAISAPDQACQDVPVSFSGSVTKTNDVTWNWDFGNNETSAAQQPAGVSYAQPGPVQVKLTVTSKDGCADETIHPLNILPLPDIKASAPADFVCLGNATLLHAGGGSIYEWTPAAGLNDPSLAEPTAAPAVNTTYQVKVTDDNGCINNDEVSIRVAQPFKIQATPDTVLCLGDRLPLQVSGTDYYTWTGAGIDNPSSPAPIATLVQTGQYLYEVTGFDKDNCFTDKAALAVTVQPTPTVNAGIDRDIMAGIPVYLTANTSNDVIRWQWSPAGSLDCSSCARVQAFPDLTTKYLVEVENTYGCKASDDVVLHILCSQSAIFMPSAFTPNHDGQNERIYPKGKGVKEVEWLRIYDRWGGLVFENTHFPVNAPASGWDGRSGNKEAPIGTYIYFMQTVCEGGEKFEFKGSITLIK